MRSTALLMTAALMLAGSLPGCSARDDKGRVQGTVQVDGAPLKSGNVRFVPVGGASATSGAPIVDGRFDAAVAPGTMRVEISAPKVVGKQKMIDAPNAPQVDIVEELLPAKYNVRSELTIEVQSGSQEQNFDLNSK